MMNWKIRLDPSDRLALGLFVLLALVLTGPALFSGGGAVCASGAPDTWVHMWAFWRTKYALHGNDVSYFVSHVITYPGTMREPIAVFDPLLPLMAAALQVFPANLPTVFNLLVTIGLAFTGMAGYLFTSAFTRNPSAAFVGGVVAAANPFIYRQIAGGYTEYAWWGLIPLTAWLYIKAISHGGIAAKAGYIVSLFLTFLMSIYCAAVFTAFALLAFLYEVGGALHGKTHRVRRTLRLQLLAVFCLTPLLLFWFHNLSLLGYRGIPWNKDFSREEVKEIEAMVGQAEPMKMNDLDKFSTWRTMHGSLDAADLLSLSANWTTKEHHRRSRSENVIPFLAGMEYGYFESVFAVEWLIPLVVAALAFRDKRLRWNNAGWIAAALVFLVLALGPFLNWKGRAFTVVSLPYAWLYRWLPGFSRLNIPGRAFLGTLLCGIIPVARGAGMIADVRFRYLPKMVWQRQLILVSLIFLSFAWLGYSRISLPCTQAPVSRVYQIIAEDKDSSALLELPIRGNLDYRMYSQGVHGKPIYRAIPATFMTEIRGMDPVAGNILVRTLETEYPRPPAKAELIAAVEFLAKQKFRYLLLHADGYDLPNAFESACSIVESCLGKPFFEDGEITAWRLTR